jgi:SAM-dependent methyltransferase
MLGWRRRVRPSALDYLACPSCGSPLGLEATATDPDGHVMTGTLTCGREGTRFSLAGGVPVLLPPDVEQVKVDTAQRFAEEWSRWSDLRVYYERQFLAWVAPLAQEDFAGQVVFEGGCGKGRHTDIVARFGARAVVSIDLGASAHVAFRNTRHLPNAHIAMGDLLRPPVASVFDLAFSVGVIHHLPDPAAGLRSLAASVKRGGRAAIWVYGRENNEWIPRFVDPLRRVLTSKLDPSTLRWLSALPSAALWAAIRLFFRGGGKGLPAWVPYREYLASMHDFPVDEIHSIVFDQLVTPVAHYLSQTEVREFFSGPQFSQTVIRWHNQHSWTAVSRVGAPLAEAAAGTATTARTAPPA